METSTLVWPASGALSSTVSEAGENEPDYTGAEDSDYSPGEKGPYYVPNLEKGALNIATQLKDEQLTQLGNQVVEDYDEDVGSCSEVLKERAEHTKNFAGKKEPRPDGIANIHVPIVTVADAQYSARATEAIVTPKGLVNIKATGREDEKRADRVSRHMNFQLQHQVDDFQQEMDVALLEQGLYGSVFRKVYWDTYRNRVAIVTIPASDVIISYQYRGPVDQCRRITHVLRMTRDDIRFSVRDGVFTDAGWELPGTSQSFPENAVRDEAEKTDGITKSQPRRSEDGTREVLEQHCRLDIEGTGVQQPYVVTVDYATRKVLRITSREYIDERGQSREICYFVHYQFMPGPGFYGQGLGSLLGGLQAAADTLVNQLTDAGTYQNNPIHLVSERSNMPKGTLYSERGRFIPVDAMAEDLKHAIFRIDFGPPSPVLQQLLVMVEQWAQRISSVTDILSGLDQPTNQTATTTMTLAEQGLKLFSAVHKRTRAAFTQELKLVYLMNRLHLTDDEYSRVLGEDLPEWRQWNQMRQMKQQLGPALAAAMQGDPQAAAAVSSIPPQMLKAVMSVPEYPFSVALDYADGVDIVPVADPAIASKAEKLTLAKEAFQVVMAVPTAAQDPAAVHAAAYRMLDAMGIQDIDEILPPLPPPAPPPDNPQEIENAMFFKEQPSMVHTDKPVQYHVEHLGVMDQFDREGFYRMLSPGGQKLFDAHRREHLASEYLLTHQQQGTANGLPPQAPPGTGDSTLPPGIAASVGDVDPGVLLPPNVGAGSVTDNAPASLLGRFPGLANQGPG